MKKRILSILLTVCLTLTAIPPFASAAEAPATRAQIAQFLVDGLELESRYDENVPVNFADLTKDHPNYRAIATLVGMGVLYGTIESSGTTYFYPTQSLTRARLSLLLERLGAQGGMPTTIPNDLPNNSSTSWYYSAAMGVLACGVMRVYSDNTFRPNSPVYLSEIYLDALRGDPDTDESPQMDLSLGSIMIRETFSGATLVTQGERAIRTTSRNIVIRQSGSTTSNTISVNSGDFSITLAGVNIETDSSAVTLSGNASIKMNLVGENTTKGGILVPEGTALTINGGGALTSTGAYYCAGIGGGNSSCGTITIDSGTVTAMGGNDGNSAGIGGTYSSRNVGTIIINGGTISATGGSHSGSGIGDVGTIIINGGDVTASGYYSAIGNCDSLTVSEDAKLTFPDHSGNRPSWLDGCDYDLYERIFDLELPSSVAVNSGNPLDLVTAARSHSGITYQWQISPDSWQRSYDEGDTWAYVPGENYSTLLLSTTRSENGALYRCVITAANGDELASDSARITVETGEQTYTVRYYQENADGSGYTVVSQDVLPGETGQTVIAPEKTFEGFSENKTKSTASGTVSSNLILSRYFDRNTYEIVFQMNGGPAMPSLSGKYGAPLSAPADPSRYGYQFAGWYADIELTQPYTFGTMPLNGAAVYAKWIPKGQGRGIEYHIEELAFRDAGTYESLGDIPSEDFLAEVTVTNLVSSETDSVLLITYDKNGKMLGMSYLYANQQIGQTITLGTRIQNRDGQVGKVKDLVLPSLSSPIPLANAVERT